MSLMDIASKIVRICLGVRKEEMVRIHTWGHSLDLASLLAIECYRLGAVPLVTVMTDKIFREGLSIAPVEVLSMPSKHELGMLEHVDAQIIISGPTDPETLRAVSPERIQAYRKGGVPIIEIEKRRKIRAVQLHLGKVTPERAERYSIDHDMWWSVMIEALDIDYQELSQIGKSFAQKLEKGRTVRIKTEEGTDIMFEIDRDSIVIDDGIINEDDLAHERIVTNLPAGILDVSPIKGSAEGRVFVNTPQFRMGQKIVNIVMSFKRGTLTEIKAEKNIEALDETFERICLSEPVLNRVGFGLNPKMKSGFLFDEIILGNISIAIGGENASCVVSGTLKNATVYVDNKPILVNGKIQ